MTIKYFSNNHQLRFSIDSRFRTSFELNFGLKNFQTKNDHDELTNEAFSVYNSNILMARWRR